MQIRGSQIKDGGVLNQQIGAGAAIALSKLAEAVVQADGGQAFTANQSMGSNNITNLADPVSDQDASTKAYVDAVASGLQPKKAVRVATVAAGTLSTAYANASVVDGVSLVTGDRILLKDQSTGAENGIYTVNASGAPTRSTDADISAEVSSGMFCFVSEGTTNADTGWVLATNNSITLNTTALVFTQFSSAGVAVAGAGLTKTGTTLDVATANTSLTINANDIAVNVNGSGGIVISSGLNINVDASSIEIAANALQVKALGIVAGMVAADAIDKTKINPDVAGKGIVQAAGGELDVGEVSEVPSGLVNSSNTTYTLTSTPANGKVIFSINGIIQLVGVDYTLSGTTITATGEVPQTGDLIRVEYLK